MEPPRSAPELLASWTFHRRREWLTIQREAIPGGGLRLVVVENGRSREFTFAGLDRLVPFQCDMEASLVNDGWALVEFVPDRRQGGERRVAMRASVDRRRWWTNAKR